MLVQWLSMPLTQTVWVSMPAPWIQFVLATPVQFVLGWGVVAWISKKASFGLDARVYAVAVAARTEFGRASAIMRFKTATPMAASHRCASGRRERSRAPIMVL
jgi:cation transport ATPase